MASVLQLTTALRSLLQSIHNKLAGKLDAAATAVNASKLEGNTATQLKQQVIDSNLGHVVGRPGEVPYFVSEGVPMALGADELVRKIKMAATDAAITTLKSGTVPFSDIFNKWTRISHGNNLVFPNNANELNGWSYDSATDRISSTINSASLIGIISLDRFDSYEFETIMKSTNADDDGVGMCLAFRKIGDREYTLSAMVDGGGLNEDTVVNGNVPKLMIVVNYNQGAANGRVTLASLPLGITAQGWTATDLSAGVKLYAKRTADGQLQVTCTRANGSAWPNPVTWTGPIPELFLGKCAIGYVALSQAAATWQNLKLPTAKVDIIDKRDLTVWRWDGTVWINAGKANNAAVLPPGRIYKNTEGPGFEAMYLDHEGVFLMLGNPSIL